MALGQKLGAKDPLRGQFRNAGAGIPPAFLFAAEQCGGTLNLGSMSAVCAVRYRGGVKFYERTPLLSFSEGSSIVCKTAHGSATAPVMVWRPMLPPS